MEYVDFMKACSDLPLDSSLCKDCGGTGTYAIMCCAGVDCGCLGLPVDFELECPTCHRVANIENGKIIPHEPLELLQKAHDLHMHIRRERCDFYVVNHNDDDCVPF